jgi:transglutaminase-like putative cysteine protease
VDYAVTHETRFEYLGPVSESIMEVRLHPRTDGGQDVLEFAMTTNPAAAIFAYVDAFGNEVRHFDIVAPHSSLVVRTNARVRTSPARELPDRLEPAAWQTVKERRERGELWDFFEPSPRVPASTLVPALAASLGVTSAPDPLTSIRRIVSGVHQLLAYVPDSTTVDTPLDIVIETRRGVCQDFAHVALALARSQGLPCRYASGYFAPVMNQPASQNLTSHAWIEVWLPGLDWVGLDPTHDLVAGERHISVAVGDDYGAAAPTRGVFLGGPAGALTVTVQIEQAGVQSRGEMRWNTGPAAATAPPTVAHFDQ